MAGEVDEPAAHANAIAADHHPPFGKEVPFEEGGKTLIVDRALNAAQLILDGERKAAVVFEEIGDGPVLPRRGEEAGA